MVDEKQVPVAMSTLEQLEHLERRAKKLVRRYERAISRLEGKEAGRG